VCCSVLQCVAVCLATVCCSVLQCVAVCCSVLQCVAIFVWSNKYVRWSSFRIWDDAIASWVEVAVCCNELQCVAECCSCLIKQICQMVIISHTHDAIASWVWNDIFVWSNKYVRWRNCVISYANWWSKWDGQIKISPHIWDCLMIALITWRYRVA